jgi:hypothetical protein
MPRWRADRAVALTHISDMTPVMARRRMQLAVRKSLRPVPFGSTVGATY